MSEHLLSVGLLLEELGQVARYKILLENNHCALACAVTAKNLSGLQSQPDAWLIELDAGIDNPVITEWLEKLQKPVIFGDGLWQPSYADSQSSWQRRMDAKIQQLAGMVNLTAASIQRPTQVWVLAASTGGPAAVKEFLSALPPDLGVAFIYAQHIDSRFDVTLAQVVSRNSHYPAVLASHGALIAANSVLIVRPEHVAEVHTNGTVVVHDKVWAGSYQPAINQVMANVASVFGSKSGAIVFTGMGDDGRAAAKLMKQQGGVIWVQSSSSCTVSSMPDEVKSTGVVTFEGSPVELAAKLAEHTQYKLALGTN